VSERDREETEERRQGTAGDRGRTARIAVGAVAALALVAATAVFIVRSRPDPGCGDWETQFDVLSEGLALYVRSKGPAQLTALDHLDALDLRCDRVAKARDVCAEVYRHLLLAEVEHARAKQALGELERAVAGLDEPLRSVAEHRFIENEATFEIAEKLELRPDEVRQHLESARKALGPDRITEIHGRFEKAVGEAKRHVDAARGGNEACDAAYKRLLEEEQGL
jgi:hypothetical protein